VSDAGRKSMTAVINGLIRMRYRTAWRSNQVWHVASYRTQARFLGGTLPVKVYRNHCSGLGRTTSSGFFSSTFP
jgi:hypothetical protein